MEDMHVPSTDELFKTFLTHPDTARDFFSVYLPINILPLCDLRTLQLEPASFVENQLYSDVLYSVKTTKGEGYIYCLIVRQSRPDPLIGFRLMHDAILVMDNHLRTFASTTLPLVVPLLFSHGSVRPYPYSTNWLDGFFDPIQAREMYTNAFPLVDLSVISDDEIMTHKGVALLELILKHIRNRDDFRELVEEGIENVIEEGIKKGREEGREEVARALLQQGVDHSIIIQCTGLTREKIESLKH
ncbi:Rpn family recombination-promoting nuclease/putative transposase [Morganella morganii]|nr:Rpn family recombination-promoting nuclease/putative transposase [Morganella morganii]